MVRKFEVCAVTHTGLVRENNEDRIAVNSWASSSNDKQLSAWYFLFDKPLVCLVADGMGGHAAGEIASRIAAEELSSRLQPTGSLNEIGEIIEEVNQEIYSSMREESYGMGTTVAGVRFEGKSAVIFNVGDSRVYVFDSSTIKQVSVDDTLSVASNNNKKHSHAVTQSLGGSMKRQRIFPHILEIVVERGQKIILCSDGLSDLVDDHEIENILRLHPTNDVTHLLNLALTRGGVDNISIVSVAIK